MEVSARIDQLIHLRHARTRRILQRRKPDYWERAMANGWTPERRARQAALIRTWRPREYSTRPRTAQGKARTARNGDKGEAWRIERDMLRSLGRTLKAQRQALSGCGTERSLFCGWGGMLGERSSGRRRRRTEQRALALRQECHQVKYLAKRADALPECSCAA